MGYLGVFLDAYRLGQEAAEDVKVSYNLTTAEGQKKFIRKSFDNVESYSQLGRYSHIGGELMRMKDPDTAVDKYDRAVYAGIKNVFAKRVKTQHRIAKKKRMGR